MDVYSADVERKMQRFFGWLSEKDRRRYAAVEAAKLGMVGSSTSHGSWRAIRKLFVKVSTSWRMKKMPRPGASEKKGGTPTASRGAADPRGKSPPTVAGVYRGRSDARRRVMDQSVAARVGATVVGAGHACESPYDPEAAEKTQIGLPHGAEEKDDGPPPRPQRAI